MTSKGGNTWSDRHLCLLAAAGMAAIMVYGSLLPFDLSAPGSMNSGAWREQSRCTTAALASRTDFLVNLATAVPLGFFLMGALQSGRAWRSVELVFGLLLVGCGSAVLGGILELLQLLSATRISSREDVLAQVVGAGAGAITWALFGPAVVVWLRRTREDHESFGFAARLLTLYVPIYVIMQLTSKDAQLPTRPIALVPVTFHPELTVAFLRTFVGNAILAAPLGMLAVLTPIRAGRRRCAVPATLVGLSGVIVLEIAQTIIWSVDADMSEMLAGALGVAMGTRAMEWARRCARADGDPSLRPNRWVLVATGGWVLVLLAALLYPFDFQLDREILWSRLHHIPLIPFASSYPSYSSAPVSGLREILRRLLLGVPLGLLLHMARPATQEPTGYLPQAVITIAIATMVFLGVEIGQIFVMSGYPDITEVVLGAAGAALGVQLVQRSRVQTRRGEGLQLGAQASKYYATFE